MTTVPRNEVDAAVRRMVGMDSYPNDPTTDELRRDSEALRRLATTDAAASSSERHMSPQVILADADALVALAGRYEAAEAR